MKSIEMNPRESGKYIAENSKHITINHVPFPLNSSTQSISDRWHSFPGHPEVSHPHLIDYIFLLDSLNFSFWSDVEWTIEGRGGYAGMVQAIARAARSCDIWDPRVYGKLSFEEVVDIFRTDQGQTVPMLKERHAILIQNATQLISQFNGTADHLLHKGDASDIALLVANVFPNFNDHGEFNGQPVSFLKRAQIFVADCYAASHRSSITNPERLTMFADYRVPQVLQSMGYFSYSDQLLRALSTQEVSYGSEMEMEIRGCSIQAVELISKETGLMPLEIDFMLWDYAGKHWDQVSKYPIHKCRTIFY